MTAEDAAPLAPLSPEDTARLVEFARACKAAARAVLLYPAAHPAITATLGRIVETTSGNMLPQALHLTVLPDSLLQDGRAPSRPDQALAELAVLLHDHLVGEIIVHPGGDREGWHSFLLLLGRTPASVRAEGGIAYVWAGMAGQNIELREIDYAEVLRERNSGASASWETIIGHCVSGGAIELDEAAMSELLGIAGDADRVIEIMNTVEKRTEGGVETKAASLMRVIRGFVRTVSKNDADRVDPMLRNMASAVGELSPDLLIGLLSQDANSGDEARVMDAIVSRMTDQTIAHFVSKNVIADG